MAVYQLVLLEKKKKGKSGGFRCCLNSEKRAYHLNLLQVEDYYYEDDEIVQEEPLNYQYVWIKNLCALVGSELSKYKRKKKYEIGVFTTPSIKKSSTIIHWTTSIEKAAKSICRTKIPIPWSSNNINTTKESHSSSTRTSNISSNQSPTTTSPINDTSLSGLPTTSNAALMTCCLPSRSIGSNLNRMRN